MRLSEIVEDVPVAYIDVAEERKDGDSLRQEIVDISRIGFIPKELIFDLDADGRILGVELL